MPLTRVVILSDTHLPRRGRTLPDAAWEHLSRADLVLHAGDVCSRTLLDEIAGMAPLYVAMGNCDPPEVRDWGARDEIVLEVASVRVAMTHDAGPREGRARRMRRRFPDARVVVFGHSHLPVIEDEGGVLLLNPGSPTDKRRAPNHTIAVLEVEHGRPRAEIVVVD